MLLSRNVPLGREQPHLAHAEGGSAPRAGLLAETHRIHAAMRANLDARRPLSARRGAILRSLRNARKPETIDGLTSEFDALGERLELLGAEFDQLAGRLYAEGQRLVAVAHAALQPYQQGDRA